MRMFICKFIMNGVIRNIFYREGETCQQVKDVLDSFDFGTGKWIVSEVDEDE